MLYAIKPNKTSYEVVETQTGNQVRVGLREPEAKKLCRHLNFGGGFDGFTPDFFLKGIEHAN